MRTKRGQLSTEYLILVGFISFLVISILGFSLFYTSSVQDSLRFSNIAQFSNKVLTSAESVFYAGEPSRTPITAYLPSGVTSLDVLDNELVFYLETSSGPAVVSYRSNVPLQGSISHREGVKRLTLEAKQTFVLISEG